MESSSTSPRIVELAAKISISVSQIQKLLSSQGVPSPSFTENSPERLPANTLHLQDAVLDATTELHELLMEPVRLIFKFCAVRALNRREYNKLIFKDNKSRWDRRYKPIRLRQCCPYRRPDLIWRDCQSNGSG